MAEKQTEVSMSGSLGGRIETWVERSLFAARWLIAPFYLGMALALVGLLIVFCRQLVGGLAHIAALDAEHALLLALSLIDLSLAANLMLIVMLAGYENFVSRMHFTEHEDRPAWMGTVDFADLKIKVIASIVAISAIALLRAFLPLGEPDAPVDGRRLLWMVVIHLAFVVSALLLTFMDRLSGAHEAPHSGGNA